MNIFEQVYDAILEEFDRRQDVRLVRADYYPQIMGNFIISFTVDQLNRSLVKETFQLFLCDDLGGRGDRVSVVRDVRKQPIGQIVEEIRKLT